MKISPVNLNFISSNRIKPAFFKEEDTFNALKTMKTAPEYDCFQKSDGGFSFKGRRGEVLGRDGKVFIGNATYMFRGDLDWKRFGNFLAGRFGECDKVNVYNYAASSGYEPYSLSILLQAKFKDEAEKFFPIFAKDIDREMIFENIIRQKTGNVEIEEGYDRAQRVLRLDRDELRSFMKPDKLLYGATLYNHVTKPVKFKCANILEDIKNIDSDNPSIVMCRNMWPYVDKNEYEDFARRLYDRLKEGSVVVVGDFDYSEDNNFPPKLIEAGFVPLDENDRYNLIFLKD